MINFRNNKLGKHIKVFLCLFVLIAQFLIPFIHTWGIAVEEEYNTATESIVSNFFDTDGDVKNEKFRSETGQEPLSNHNPADCIICQNLLQPQNYVVTNSFSASFLHQAKSFLTTDFTSDILDPNLLASSPRAPPYFS